MFVYSLTIFLIFALKNPNTSYFSQFEAPLRYWCCSQSHNRDGKARKTVVYLFAAESEGTKKAFYTPDTLGHFLCLFDNMTG